MNSYETTHDPAPIPKARVEQRRFRFPLIWLIPLVAAAVAAYLVYHRVHQVGPRIKIQFEDGSGLKPGQSVVKFRGVTIGEVVSIELAKDSEHVIVEAKLIRSAASMAREGSVFWIVRPELGIGSVTGLGTIISGSYIEVVPGTGASKQVFEGRPKSPVQRDDAGLKIVLMAPKRGSVKAGSPIYYRGIQVGTVQELDLNLDARGVIIKAFIQKRFVPLVRQGTKFWNASGFDIDIGLFKGAQVNVESLQTLVSGGIAFATPEGAQAGEVAREGDAYRLYEEPDKKWQEWSPSITIDKQQ